MDVCTLYSTHKNNLSVVHIYLDKHITHRHSHVWVDQRTKYINIQFGLRSSHFSLSLAPSFFPLVHRIQNFSLWVLVLSFYLQKTNPRFLFVPLYICGKIPFSYGWCVAVLLLFLNICLTLK